MKGYTPPPRLSLSNEPQPITRNITITEGISVKDLAEKLGIANVNVPGFPATSGFPQIFLGFGASTGGSTYKPLTFSDQNFQLTDNYSWITGKHDFKFGYDFRRLVANPNFCCVSDRISVLLWRLLQPDERSNFQLITTVRDMSFEFPPRP